MARPTLGSLAAGCWLPLLPRTSTALSAAVPNASEMTVGWTPRSSSSRLFFSSAPHMTVTDVVPSPATTSCSSAGVGRNGRCGLSSEQVGCGKQGRGIKGKGRWQRGAQPQGGCEQTGEAGQPPTGLACDFARSTSILAAGCSTRILFRMVAPSLVMITSPSACATCGGRAGGQAEQQAGGSTAAVEAGRRGLADRSVAAPAWRGAWVVLATAHNTATRLQQAQS